jgi:hypothetical protein
MQSRRYRIAMIIPIVLSSMGAGHHHHRDETPPPGKPRCIPHTHERAGCPQCLSGCAAPTINPSGKGYYVGGGSAFVQAGPRCRQDGTWGWDETGSVCLPRRVRLGWNHGGRYQGGGGTYATDRPHTALRRLLPTSRDIGN